MMGFVVGREEVLRLMGDSRASEVKKVAELAL
jgi:hypothetical protein